MVFANDRLKRVWRRVRTYGRMKSDGLTTASDDGGWNRNVAGEHMGGQLTYKGDGPGARRGLGLGAVILIHGLLIWALTNGLGAKVVEAVKSPLIAKIIETPPEVKRDEIPPPPPPVLDTPPPFVPPPEITINAPAPAPHAIQAVQSKVAAPSTPTEPAVTPRADPDHPNRKPPYPASSVRMGEEGTVVLNLYIRTDGTVQEARVEKSSGFAKLDQSAVRYAESNWRFLPAMQAGMAVAVWHRVAVTFRLDQQ